MDKERIILPDPTDIALDRIAPVMAQMAAIQLSLATRLMAASTERPQSDADSLLTIEEAAARLKCSADWLYRHAKRLPFTVRMGATCGSVSTVSTKRFVPEGGSLERPH
jgi:hypothetical protein